MAAPHNHAEIFLVIGNIGSVEMQRVFRVSISQLVSALRGANAVIVDAVILVGIGEFLSFSRTVLCTVEESVTSPVGSGEFCPFYVVVKQGAVIGLHYVNLGPVTTAA